MCKRKSCWCVTENTLFSFRSAWAPVSSDFRVAPVTSTMEKKNEPRDGVMEPRLPCFTLFTGHVKYCFYTSDGLSCLISFSRAVRGFPLGSNEN